MANINLVAKRTKKHTKREMVKDRKVMLSELLPEGD